MLRQLLGSKDIYVVDIKITIGTFSSAARTNPLYFIHGHQSGFGLAHLPTGPWPASSASSQHAVTSTSTPTVHSILRQGAGSAPPHQRGNSSGSVVKVEPPSTSNPPTTVKLEPTTTHSSTAYAITISAASVRATTTVLSGSASSASSGVTYPKAEISSNGTQQPHQRGNPWTQMLLNNLEAVKRQIKRNNETPCPRLKARNIQLRKIQLDLEDSLKDVLNPQAGTSSAGVSGPSQAGRPSARPLGSQAGPSQTGPSQTGHSQARFTGPLLKVNIDKNDGQTSNNTSGATANSSMSSVGPLNRNISSLPPDVQAILDDLKKDMNNFNSSAPGMSTGSSRVAVQPSAAVSSVQSTASAVQPPKKKKPVRTVQPAKSSSVPSLSATSAATVLNTSSLSHMGISAFAPMHPLHMSSYIPPPPSAQATRPPLPPCRSSRSGPATSRPYTSLLASVNPSGTVSGSTSAVAAGIGNDIDQNEEEVSDFVNRGLLCNTRIHFKHLVYFCP